MAEAGRPVMARRSRPRPPGIVGAQIVALFAGTTVVQFSTPCRHGARRAACRFWSNLCGAVASAAAGVGPTVSAVWAGPLV